MTTVLALASSAPNRLTPSDRDDLPPPPTLSMEKHLSLNLLQTAARARLPHFTSAQGALSHKVEDGSDWSPADWLAATLGELGEFAQERIQYEDGHLQEAAYREVAGKELADVQIYMATLATRALDKTEQRAADAPRSSTELLMEVIAHLGAWANLNKKVQRGDFEMSAIQEQTKAHLDAALQTITVLRERDVNISSAPVVQASPTGVQLDAAVSEKFNEVSIRVGAPLFLENGALIDVREVPEQVPDVVTAAVDQVLSASGARADLWRGRLVRRFSAMKLVFLAAEELAQSYQLRDIDFVYDLASNVTLAGATVPHVELLSELYRVYSGMPPGPSSYKLADRFVEDGLGIFKSRAGTKILTPKGFTPTGELWRLKRDMLEV